MSLAVLFDVLLMLIMMILHESRVPYETAQKIFVDASYFFQLVLYHGAELVFELLVPVEVYSPRVFSHFCKIDLPCFLLILLKPKSEDRGVGRTQI